MFRALTLAVLRVSAVPLALCAIPLVVTATLLVRLDQPSAALIVLTLPALSIAALLLHEVGHWLALGASRPTAQVRVVRGGIQLLHDAGSPAQERFSAACGPLLPVVVGMLLAFTSRSWLVFAAPVFLVHACALFPPSHDGRIIWRGVTGPATA